MLVTSERPFVGRVCAVSVLSGAGDQEATFRNSRLNGRSTAESEAAFLRVDPDSHQGARQPHNMSQGGNPLENELNMYKTIQKEIGKVQSQQGTAQTQILENEMVLKVRASLQMPARDYAHERRIIYAAMYLTFFVCIAQELELLEEDSSVFKLIGPVLVKQELVEVKNNVTKRVEFIKNDISRLENTVKKFNEQLETVKGNIGALQKGAAQAQAAEQ